MLVRLLVAGFLAAIALPSSANLASANPALTDPDGRLHGGAPQSARSKGLFEILALRKKAKAEGPRPTE